jgi:hypothetical protein
VNHRCKTQFLCCALQEKKRGEKKKTHKSYPHTKPHKDSGRRIVKTVFNPAQALFRESTTATMKASLLTCNHFTFLLNCLAVNGIASKILGWLLTVATSVRDLHTVPF